MIFLIKKTDPNPNPNLNLSRGIFRDFSRDTIYVELNAKCTFNKQFYFWIQTEVARHLTCGKLSHPPPNVVSLIFFFCHPKKEFQSFLPFVQFLVLAIIIKTLYSLKIIFVARSLLSGVAYTIYNFFLSS